MNGDLKPRLTKGASVSPTSNGFRLTIPASSQSEYRLAQLDDYANLARRNFPRRYLTLSLRARISSESIPGTWGFGLWNDPFGLSLGFGGNPFQIPALPNAVWFFYGSQENYLSFKDNRPERSRETAKSKGKPSAPRLQPPASARRDIAVNGFIAQSFRAPKFHPLLIPAGMAFPFSRRTTRKYLSRIIDEDSAALSVDSTQWHAYRLEWSLKRSAFWVDETLVLKSPVSPHPPLGLVVWIDNQFAAFKPDGKISMGVLAGKEEWLEIEELEIKRSPE